MGKSKRLQIPADKTRYALGMTTLNASTTYRPLKSAAVVSSTFWKRWGVSAVDTLEAETVRGPLIIWAKPAAKEEAPKLEEPKPTPLEGRVSAVNTAAHFERFHRAAGGRKKIKYITHKYFCRRAFLRAMKAITFLDGSCLDRQTWKVLRSIESYGFLSKTGKRKRDLPHWHPDNKSIFDDCFFGNIDDYYLYESILRAYQGHEGKEALEGIEESINLRDFLVYVALSDPKSFMAIRAFFDNRPLTMYLLLKRIQAAAYLAHVRRRVKPAPRRERIPRPIYARPRPPTAPLAPPVTC